MSSHLIPGTACSSASLATIKVWLSVYRCIIRRTCGCFRIACRRSSGTLIISSFVYSMGRPEFVRSTAQLEGFKLTFRIAHLDIIAIEYIEARSSFRCRVEGPVRPSAQRWPIADRLGLSTAQLSAVQVDVLDCARAAVLLRTVASRRAGWHTCVCFSDALEKAVGNSRSARLRC